MKVIKKTFSMPEDELSLIETIKDKCLNAKIVLGEGEAIRLALMIAAELSDKQLQKASSQLTRIPMGRRKS